MSSLRPWSSLLRGFARVRELLPSRWLHWSSVVLLLVVFASYAVLWVGGNWEMLTDPALQNDDARTAVFPFHRYGPEGALSDDPIANEMMAFVTVGLWLLYRVFVPLTDLYVASKLVQLVALGILLYAGVLLARSRRGGLGAGLLLLFLMLHDDFAINRIAGGHARAFGFPCVALWIAAVLAQRTRVRYAAAVLAALTYPTAMNMILAAEGLYALRSASRIKRSVLLRRLARYGAVVGVCFVCVLPATLGGEERGPPHTLEQALKEPAFGKRGRLWVLPFGEPTHEFGDALVASLRPKGESPLPGLARAYREHLAPLALVVMATLLLLPLLRLTPVPWPAAAFLLGALVMYAISRLYAFRLYSPERYYSFGARMVTIAFITALLAHLYFWKAPLVRATLRNFAAATMIVLIWFAVGSGIVRRNGMTISAHTDRPMYDFIRTLPLDVRFASHPLDGDGIPYFGARAHVGSFETLQPWFVDSWRRQRERAEDTLRALYAVDVGEVLRYADRHAVTHFLINERRYQRDFRRHVGSFDPLTQFAAQLVSSTQQERLVFARLVPDAIVFRHAHFVIVDVKRLRKAAGG